MQVSVGRIVHIGSIPCALLVTAVNADGTINGLMYLPDASTEPKLGLHFSETPSDTAWSWPPRV